MRTKRTHPLIEKLNKFCDDFEALICFDEEVMI